MKLNLVSIGLKEILVDKNLLISNLKFLNSINVHVLWNYRAYSEFLHFFRVFLIRFKEIFNYCYVWKLYHFLIAGNAYKSLLFNVLITVL